MNQQARYLVTTTVQLKPGRLSQVASLFADTNPALVKNEVDWVGAVLTSNSEANEVTVLAYWTSAESYISFSAGAVFRDTMGQFAEHFVAPPTVRISSILVGMNQEALWRVDK